MGGLIHMHVSATIPKDNVHDFILFRWLIVQYAVPIRVLDVL